MSVPPFLVIRNCHDSDLDYLIEDMARRFYKATIIEQGPRQDRGGYIKKVYFYYDAAYAEAFDLDKLVPSTPSKPDKVKEFNDNLDQYKIDYGIGMKHDF